MKEGNNMVVRVRWEEFDNSVANLIANGLTIAQVCKNEAGWWYETCGEVESIDVDSLAAAKAHVESVLGVERNGGEG